MPSILYITKTAETAVNIKLTLLKEKEIISIPRKVEDISKSIGTVTDLAVQERSYRFNYGSVIIAEDDNIVSLINKAITVDTSEIVYTGPNGYNYFNVSIDTSILKELSMPMATEDGQIELFYFIKDGVVSSTMYNPDAHATQQLVIWAFYPEMGYTPSADDNLLLSFRALDNGNYQEILAFGLYKEPK